MLQSVLTRLYCLLMAAAILTPLQAHAASAEWPAIVARARGQTVYWQAFGGDENANRFIAWVAGEVKQRYGIDLHHVKAAASETVTQVIAEKAAGRLEGGRVDLIWINGTNFAAMKERGLLYGPITHVMPHFALVDTVHKPTTVLDFTVATMGLEAPWGMAQFVFYADIAHVKEPPRTLPALREWAVAHPGRFTYPAPPDFNGTTFIKQVLLDSVGERSVLYQPLREQDFARITAPVWRYLDSLHPYLWRKGASFPASYAAMRQLINDGETDIGFSFNPAEAASASKQKLLPSTVRPYVLDGGTIGNAHFVAIPFNANAKDAAMVVADFLMTPEAQSRKANPDVWGDPTVLDLDKLSDDERALFDKLPRARIMPTRDELQRILPEPHPSWATRIEQEWLKRYAR